MERLKIAHLLFVMSSMPFRQLGLSIEKKFQKLLLFVKKSFSSVWTAEVFNSEFKQQRFSIQQRESDQIPGGGTPLYRLYRYVRPQRVWFFGSVGHK